MAEEQAQQESESQINGAATVAAVVENITSKRQRRPSVRLGDIGDQPATLSYDSHARRSKQYHDYKYRKDSIVAGKPSSRTRPLTNLVNAGEFHETLDVDERDRNLDNVAIGSWRGKQLKLKRSFTKRARSNWASKGGEAMEGGEDKASGGENVDDGNNRELEGPEGSDSLDKEASPNLSGDVNRQEGREWRGGSSVDRNENRPSSADGVRIWLEGLGLGRYAPVFEIHEVDDEVLPMLTLEDLKDMGINAVGSRRKMFCAIQKLGKGFS